MKAYEKGRKEGREEGREEGEKIKAVQIAKNLLSSGMSIEATAAATGLDIDDIKAL